MTQENLDTFEMMDEESERKSLWKDFVNLEKRVESLKGIVQNPPENVTREDIENYRQEFEKVMMKLPELHRTTTMYLREFVIKRGEDCK